MKSSIQIVDLGSGVPRHVRKLTVDLSGAVTLEKILEFFEGHLVNKNSGQKSAQIAGKKPLRGKSRGKAHFLPGSLAEVGD